jgi:mono/diheme cytochrome c family protein
MPLRSVLLLGLVLLGAPLTGPAVARAADGKELFVAGKCQRCHSVESQGIAAKSRAGEEEEVADLSKVGAEHSAEWIQRYLRKEEATAGKKHRLKYRGSDEDLKTLATWLASLK